MSGSRFKNVCMNDGKWVIICIIEKAGNYFGVMKMKKKLIVLFLSMFLLFTSCTTTLQIEQSNSIVVYEGHTYLKVNKSISWTAAKVLCEKAGGYLVVLNSKAEEDSIHHFLDKNIWIGLWDENHDGNFAWVNGDTLTFTAWGNNQPDNYENIEQYVVYWKDSIRFFPDPRILWNDTRNDEYSIVDNKFGFGYICEFDKILTSDEIIEAYSVFFEREPEEIVISGKQTYSALDKEDSASAEKAAVVKSGALENIGVITVLDLEVENMSESEGKLISDLLTSSLISQQQIKVIDRNQRDQLLSEMEFSLSGCVDESCQLEIGRMLSADGIIVGSIGLVGNRYIMNIRLLDVETSEALSTSYKVFKSIDDLVDGCEGIAFGLISGE